MSSRRYHLGSTSEISSQIASQIASRISSRIASSQGFNDLELVAQIPNTQFAWVPHVGWQYWCYLLVGVMQVSKSVSKVSK